MRAAVTDRPSTHRGDGLSLLTISVPDLGIERQLDIDLTRLACHVPVPKVVALDLLLIAASCYGLDKLVDRDLAPDRWTRELDIVIPVSAPDTWNPVADQLAEVLAFLTGDDWRIGFTSLHGPLYERPGRHKRVRARPVFERPEVVCLFSGGLDSLSGAIDLLENVRSQHVLLVSHYDAPAPEQTRLYPHLLCAYPGRIDCSRTRLRLCPAAGNERTLRSRSLVFLALGLLAAHSAGPDVPLYAYENGQIAINIPMTPSRAGSCSTRTMHPFFLESVVSVLEQLGVRNSIHRPYELRTKGECLAECHNQLLLQRTASLTVSCSHPGRRQHWVRRQEGNCGYCMPCLIRRAALFHIGLDDGMQYGIDVCAGELSVLGSADSGDDLRAVLDFVAQGKTASELQREIVRVARITDPAAAASMLVRGFDEIRAVISAKAKPDVKKLSGIK